MLGIRELLIILAIVLVVFGTKRLVSAGGDLGKAIQSFKKGMRDSDAAGSDTASDKPADPAKLSPPGSDAADPSTRSGDAQGSANRESPDR